MKTIFTLLIFLFVGNLLTYAGGIKGIVKTAKGEPLAYTAVLVKGTSIGTMANADGRYELTLTAGSYEIVFQYLGFKSLSKKVEVTTGFQTLNVVLEEQALNINEVRVGSRQEDPAYTIMRRAIAKARFHALQVQSYQARAHIKAVLTITDIPFFAKKQLQKEGIVEGRPFVNESINEISFQQPNRYQQKVISTRNSIDNSGPSPNQFVMSSFYDPTVVEAVSPLSPKAFGYYRFEYEGSFREGDIEVNKIKVIPRSYGEGVFKGQIYIIENTWAIHSLDLQTRIQTFDWNTQQVYHPVQDVWMPTSQQYRAYGGFMGFAGEAKYIISVRYNNLKVNPALKESVVVLDEKFEKPATDLSKKDVRTQKLADLAKEQKEFSTKQLRGLMKEYERQERQERKAQKQDVNVVRNDSIVIDSMANKRSDEFWNEARTIPLTELEIKSYQRYDSIKVVKQLKVKTDSTKAKKDSSTINFSKYIMGGTFNLTKNKKWKLDYESPLQSGNMTYNTVEKINMVASLGLRYQLNRENSFYLKPLGRYAFGRKVFTGTIATGWNGPRRGISLKGGRYVSQFNDENPITPSLNSTTTLFFEQNLMKIYEKDFGQLSFYYNRLADVLNFSGNIAFARRYELQNHEDIKPTINWKRRSFTSNAPFNQEYSDAAGGPAQLLYRFEPHEALTLRLNLTWKPGQKYGIRNGRKYYLTNNNPTFALRYAKGFNVGASDVDFDQVEIGIKHSLQTGIRSELHYALTAGAFLNNRSLYLMDFKHFMGNEFFIQTGDAYTTFRALPYYQFSTSQRYLEAHLLNESRRLLITRIPLIRLAGLKENLMLHYLLTPTARHYAEVGYGLDGLVPGFPFFRVEAVAVFQNFKYQNTVFRIGTTLKLRR
ncbi:MAG: DUF5686 and carboxypeptidase regulatory-like domain-containing protein [Runella sp.]